jgi:GNAT superfamily N-acetyltransferase
VTVREARASDAPVLVGLLKQLGYDVSLSHAQWSIEQTGDEYCLFAASGPDEVPIGMLEVRVAPHAITGLRHALISAVVVDDGWRSGGVGAALVQAAEAWARERGCDGIHVRTNVVRDRAHAFYERLGYARSKSQHQYEKPLEAGA